MAITGGSVAVQSFPSSSYYSRKAKFTSTLPLVVTKIVTSRRSIACFAVPESSTSTVAAETKEKKEAKPAEAAPAKPKPPAKAKAKSLPEMMEEDVIPSLKAILKAQDDISDIELSFGENRVSLLLNRILCYHTLTSISKVRRRTKIPMLSYVCILFPQLEGSFLKKGNPYLFWAFFPDGDLTGPKGFSLSSYRSGPSTVEPFLVDEKKITAKHVVFWVEKRLAAQGIIPVWTE
ncbi:hypothetical protein RJ639_028240 [Escallonia herrerae]|uniref:Uncharacterized protein n=1 Tax=Escallonia herrerae TaxID=1293975 RepID=A0AA88X520_9ASTE|nr:hypothetical protein RJ639_041271 [Escallonia herrerae]KAK3039847.1 hypothetical protein RJ639_028240 [Escallonia herrerae]